jgi:hypothetical protein
MPQENGSESEVGDETKGEKPKSYLLVLVQFWFGILIVIVGGGWTAYHYWSEQAETERNLAITHRIEAQRPFLSEKLKTYIEAVSIGGELTEWEIDPKSEAWKQATKRFWQLRWSELELFGDPSIRQAMRRIGQQIVETEHDPTRKRHDLRWMVECLADELRLSLEGSWQITGDTKLPVSGKDLPAGCMQNRDKPPQFRGMLPLTAPGNATED